MSKQPEFYKFEVVAQDNRGHKESIGTYQTSVDNYVLYVDVSNRDLSNCIGLQIEFFGKVHNQTCLSQESDKPT